MYIGAILTVFIIDKLGRRGSQTLLFALGSLFCFILWVVPRIQTSDSILLFILFK